MTLDVQIKGIREGLLVSIAEGEWPDAEQALLEELGKQSNFLKGAKLILDVEEHTINAATMGRLRDQLSDQGLSLWGVLSSSPLTEQSAQAMGLATRINQAEPEAYEYEEEYEEPEVAQPQGEATLVKRTLRSGANITHPGDITIIGDVNPGAEVIAGGDIVIWGRLRGMAHAGAQGDETAVVCAMDLSPTQLRIAGHIAIPPQDREGNGAEIAFIRDGQVVAEAWNALTA
jgi:septum site-determining protein MinC